MSVGRPTLIKKRAKAIFAAGESGVAIGELDYQSALEAATRAIDESRRGGLEFAHEAIRLSYPDAVDAALGLANLDEAQRLVELVATRPPGEVPPFLRAQLARARALLSAARGEEQGVEADLVTAEAAFLELGYPYWTARAGLDRAEWLADRGRAAEAGELANDLAAAFERLGTQRWLGRARALANATDDPAAGAPVSVDATFELSSG